MPPQGDDYERRVAFAVRFPPTQRAEPAPTETRFNPHHDALGKFASGGGGGVAVGPAGINTGAPAIAKTVASGQQATASPDQVDALMKTFAKMPAANMANLSVSGAENANCYTKHLREIPRNQMPQLPTTVAELKPFADKLNGMGVSASLRQVDPRTLKMTQNQLDSAKVAKIYGFIKRDGWQQGGAMIISREGAILDGHHRWAAACAAVMTGTPVSMTALHVDMGIDDLLRVANTVSGPRKGIGE